MLAPSLNDLVPVSPDKVALLSASVAAMSMLAVSALTSPKS